MKKIIPILIVLVTFSCDGNSSDNMVSANYELEATMDVSSEKSDLSETSESSEPSQNIEKKQISTGNISFKVKSTTASYAAIKSKMSQFNAYIENENQYSNSNRISQSLTLRVPAPHFDSLMIFLTLQGTYLESKSVSLEDVSAQYYDLESRLKNQRALEVRYLELLNQTKTMSEILQIERELNAIRSDIESQQGRFNYLKQQVALSTINVNYYELLPYSIEDGNPQTFFERIAESFVSGWSGFVTFTVGIIGFWPFFILGLLVVWLIRKWRSKK